VIHEAAPLAAVATEPNEDDDRSKETAMSQRNVVRAGDPGTMAAACLR